MMMNADDMALLKAYVTNGSEEAFSGLVLKYLNLVYSTALRRVSNPQLAQDISQAVFIVLARKAGSLRQGTILPGWLYKTTCYAAADALKSEARRQKREREAQMESVVNPEQEESTWCVLAPVLDEAMARLGEKDRNAILLRFFENKSHKQIGEALGSSEESARKRVTRAVERMRTFLGSRAIGVTAASLTSLLAGKAVSAAPVGLAGSIAAQALGSGGATSLPALSIAQGTLKLLAWAKVQTVAWVTASVLAVTGLPVLAIKAVHLGLGERLATSAVQRVDLGDGTDLILEQATFGTNHVFTEDPKLAVHTEQESFVLWFSQFERATGKYRPARFTAIQALDEHGCALDLRSKGYDQGWQSGAKYIRTMPVRAYPRRQEQFLVQVYDREDLRNEPVARFTVRNPNPVQTASAPAPDFTTTITLEPGLTVQFNGYDSQKYSVGPDRYWPRFFFFQDGKRSRDWFIDDLVCSDGSGNRIRDFGRNGNTALCLLEPAWKWEMLAFRYPRAEFPDQAKWQIDSVPVPKPGMFKKLSGTVVVQGVTLRLINIAAPGRSIYSNDIPVEVISAKFNENSVSVSGRVVQFDCDQPHVCYQVTGLKPDQKLSLLLNAGLGNPQGVLGEYGANNLSFQELKIPGDVSEIGLTFIVQTGRKMEWVAPSPMKRRNRWQ